MKIAFQRLNNYTRPNTLALVTNVDQYQTNGPLNSYFYFLEEMYYASTTNTAIIDAYTDYILGKSLKANYDISNIITKNDLKLLIKDYKMTGNFAVQIVYNITKTKIINIYHQPVRCVAAKNQDDLSIPIQKYWYCFDWRNTSKFTPVALPSFTNGGKTDLSEIFFYKRADGQPIYAMPDYESGLQYCKIEESISNKFNTYIENDFSVTTIVNINQGFETPEEQELEEQKLKRSLTGTNGTPVVISVNDNKENATTVERIPVLDLYRNYDFLVNHARSSIMMAHKVTDASLFGIINSSGFASTGEQKQQSLKELYLRTIRPYREDIIDALTSILKFNFDDIELSFEDFEEYFTSTNQNQTKLSKNVEDVEDVKLKIYKFDVKSSNVKSYKYNSDKEILVLTFNDGSMYEYKKVDAYDYLDIVNGNSKPKTSGENAYGKWIEGVDPSVGAAVWEYLINKGNLGKKIK